MGAPTARTSRWRAEHGFTVSELVLVVVLVIGLVTVAVVSVRNIRKETATSSCQTELRDLKIATGRYQAENEVYPVDQAVLVEAGLLEEGQVERWELVPAAGGGEPDYEPSGSGCR